MAVFVKIDISLTEVETAHLPVAVGLPTQAEHPNANFVSTYVSRNGKKEHNYIAESVITEDILQDMKEMGIEEARKVCRGRKHKPHLVQKITSNESFQRSLVDWGDSLESTVGRKSWWNHRIDMAKGISGLNMTKHFRKSAIGTAQKASFNKQGINLEFDSVDELIIPTLLAIEEGESSADILGHWQHFAPEEAHKIALQYTTDELQKLSNHTGQTIHDILGFDPIRLQEISFCELECMARKRAKSLAECYQLDGREERHIGNLFFLSFAVRQVVYNDIVHCLTHRICGYLVRKDGSIFFPCKILKKLVVQFCVGGGTVQKGCKPNQFEREWTTKDCYIACLFGTAVYDLNASCNDSTMAPENFKIPLGNTGRFVRRLTSNKGVHNGQDMFSVAIRDDQGNKKTRRLHRLVQINAYNHNIGMSHSQQLKEYLGGKTFEEKCPYTAKDKEIYKQHLEKKGWTNVEFAKWCDVDHLVDRSELWMKGLFFTMPCSHRWNTCMTWVRVSVGDWCYGMAEIIHYRHV